MADNAGYGNSSLPNTHPSQYRIFKKRTAVRFQLDKPSAADRRHTVGCIYMEAATARGASGLDGGYNWEDGKVAVKLGVNDIVTMLHHFKIGVAGSLFHSFMKDKKTVNITPKDGGGFFLIIEHTSATVKNKVTIPLTDPEVGGLITMLTFALPLIHNWV